MTTGGRDDWETMEALEPQAGEQLERMMTRYARVRLEPSPAQRRRARSAVMEAAWRRRLEASAPAPHRWHRPFATWSRARVGLAGAAAVIIGLSLGTSAFAASRAGGPLYDARLAAEEALLPPDPAARVQAQLANAQTRLAEAYDADARGDAAALAAALRAYGHEANELAGATGPETSMALAGVEQHRAVLVALLGRAPAAALPGLNQAIANSSRVIEELAATDHGQRGTSTSNGSPAPNGHPGAGAGNGGNGVGGAGVGAGAGGASGGSSSGGANGQGAGGSGSGGGNGGGNGGGRPGATAGPAATSGTDRSPKPQPAATHKPKATATPGGRP